MSVTSCIPYVVSTCGHSSRTSVCAMSRRLVALVALVAGVGFATPAPAAADPSGDPGNVQTLTPPHPSQLDLDERFLDDLGLGVRVDLGVPDVTSHSFRKSVATMIDDAGLSARIGAD